MTVETFKKSTANNGTKIVLFNNYTSFKQLDIAPEKNNKSKLINW